ncbi:sigma-54-dependent transcriptional regulator [Alteromonas lipolytica]|uniref:Sigma-54-dependent Fis family transcriptional regulator n=1 Tax=Alteromonas lipolytica TaxID=1856405 RepID=A0A1E8FBG9_9ALTE|nr:sigma-54 dependent transcriptional regulator [Alteromonas lipolytica]OFI33272.1 sigma-54-dependent Fis family transcriptional regulator [Alteromonas lipolytica]
MDKILLVDDNPAVLEALSLLLEIHGYAVVTASTPLEARQIVNYQAISLVIQDMNFSADTTSGDEGKQLFNALRELNPHLPIILITAWTELEHAVELVKAGAADYIAKPWDDQKLVNTVANLIELGKAKSHSATLAKQQDAFWDTRQAAKQVGLVYQSTAMQRLIDMAVQVAKSDISVLITGPNGSGKEKIAQLIQACSALKDKPFVSINAGALPPDLMEAELFGAEPGAYTGAQKVRIGRFEAADGGTLFLDEIGNLSPAGQMKLLRVLQTGEFERLGSVRTQKVNVRVISATNADLHNDIQLGRFREDLYYRLNAIELRLPPLNERPDDIMPLIAHFLPGREISLEVQKALTEYPWPGNVRELENACKRVAVLKPDGHIALADFALTHSYAPVSLPAVNEPSRLALEQAIEKHEGVIARVAKEFGMSRQSLYRRLKKFGIEY